jgi:hypothetical protein
MNRQLLPQLAGLERSTPASTQRRAVCAARSGDFAKRLGSTRCVQ